MAPKDKIKSHLHLSSINWIDLAQLTNEIPTSNIFQPKEIISYTFPKKLIFKEKAFRAIRKNQLHTPI